MQRIALFLFSLILLAATQAACQQQTGTVQSATASASVAAASTVTPTPAPSVAASAAADGLTALPNGMKFKDIVVGPGQRPRFGQTVKLAYVGKNLSGKIFDQGKLEFKAGDTGYLKGWNIGLLGSGAMDAMKVGGKRYIVVPAELGFADIGVPGKVSPNETISFEMELLSVKAEK